MGARELLLRTFVKPVWLPGPAKVERWTCPACDGEVDRVSPAWKGIWFTAEPAEVVALCARTYRLHGRQGDALAIDEVLTGDDAVPIVAVEPGPNPASPPSSFVALLPPSGLVFVLDPDGQSYEVRRLGRALMPSDLVGLARARSLGGTVVGRVGAKDVSFDGLRAVRVIAELGLAVGDPPAGDALERRERSTPV